MRAFTLFSSLLAAASAASAASDYIVKNYCRDSFQLFTSNQTYTGDGPTELKSGQAYKKTIIGEGNALAVTRSTDFWNSNTAKLVLSTSIGKDNNLYWVLLVQTQPGVDPLAGQKYNVTSTGSRGNNICQQTQKSDPRVFNCADDNVELTFNLCAQY